MCCFALSVSVHWCDLMSDFVLAAHRETMEEAGIKVVLKGVLRVEHSVEGV